MKTLLLLRHGKSPHPDGMADRERPLSALAARQLRDLGRRLAADGIQPEAVLASAAPRAARSAAAFREGGDGPPPTLFDELYLATAKEILAAAQRVDNEVETLMIVGHNPGMAQCVERLSGKPLPGGGMRTGTLAILSIDVPSWAELSFGEARLQRMVESR